MNKKLKLFLPCYFAFLMSGMMVLAVGAILTYLIADLGISYSIAGGFLSSFAVGNLCASFINPIIDRKLGNKGTVICLSIFSPLCFFGVTLTKNLVILYLLFFLLGIGRGSISIFNNGVINDNSDGKPAALNLLHTLFAIGAFLAPFVVQGFISAGYSWKIAVYAISFFMLLAWFGFFTVPNTHKEVKNKDAEATNNRFLKEASFYIIGFILFFYLGVENCVNGWFITYFKSKGIMSDAYASSLVAYTWIAVMAGRLLTAYLSTKADKNKMILTNCVMTAVFFLLLISTENLGVITAAIILLGFSFAGIYPTCVSSAGVFVKGSSLGMSLLLAIAALGGIIAPQVVGIAADALGMSAGIGILLVSCAFMLILSVVNMLRRK